MSKFLIQFLLSAMIGVSAAAGFNANVRDGLKETVQDARTLVRETAQTAFETVDDLLARTGVMVDVAVDVSAEGEVNTSADKAELIGADDLNLIASPALNVDGSFAADSNLNADAATEAGELSLSEELRSTLQLNLDAGN